MPKRHFKNWLLEYDHHTRHSESPDLFHFWTGVSTIAGALRRQVWMDEVDFQWTPNFYIILVGPPGVAAKSTSITKGYRLLSEVDGIHFGPNSMTWQGLTLAFQKAKTLVPLSDSPLLEADYLVMSPLTCSIRELGTFLRTEDSELVSFLTDMWDGETLAWKRTIKSEGESTIENPWLNIIGCTTPAWIRHNISESMVGEGLISRIVFVYGDKKRKLVPYPSEIVDRGEYEDHKNRLIEDLRIISEIKGEYHRAKDATAWGKDWYPRHYANRPKHMASEKYSAYIYRKQTHIHKLAMVLAAARGDELVVEKEDLVLAEKIMTQMEGSMSQVFQSIGPGAMAGLVKEIVAIARAYKGVDDRTLWRHMMPIVHDSKAYTEALLAAQKAEYIYREPRHDGIYYIPCTPTEKGDV